MTEEGKKVFWRHRLSRESGEFRFFCSPCFDRDAADPSKSLRVQQVSEELLRRYLAEIGTESIACAGCGEVLVSGSGG